MAWAVTPGGIYRVLNKRAEVAKEPPRRGFWFRWLAGFFTDAYAGWLRSDWRFGSALTSSLSAVPIFAMCSFAAARVSWPREGLADHSLRSLLPVQRVPWSVAVAVMCGFGACGVGALIAFPLRDVRRCLFDDDARCSSVDVGNGIAPAG